MSSYVRPLSLLSFAAETVQTDSAWAPYQPLNTHTATSSYAPLHSQETKLSGFSTPLSLATTESQTLQGETHIHELITIGSLYNSASEISIISFEAEEPAD